jgi:pyruvate kinase
MHMPIYALTPNLSTQRKHGAVPQRAAAADGQEHRPRHRAGTAEAHLKKRGIVQTGDVYAITCGEPMGAARRHQHAQDLPSGLSKRPLKGVRQG